ncbi:DUF4134 family protein [Capnocytophaga canis]|uniref:Uncharacterized protein n=1 Tax=Capnocytophaga canis TaxID=1848903 RepID=A0A0B7IS11_9FLAO|nr:DUF4134 family protein [Capnocytophaga canis]CEN52728.1 exported hypothetical protein [Capnocytophaga canis]
MDKKSRIFTGIGLAIVGLQQTFAQSVAAALGEQQQEIASIAQIIVNIIIAVFGAIALVQAIMIFIGPGDGQEKIKKAGTYIFMLIFTVVAYFMSTKLFA